MTNQTLEVRKIETKADTKAFLHFHWTCYKDDPNWVPPLWSEHKAFFDREKNPELHHIDVDYFGAWRGDKLVGIICAHINHIHNETYDENMGFFGSFEVLDDEEAAHALLKTAEQWCRDKGTSAIRGPFTFSTNSEVGLLIEGFDTPPFILMTHDHPYYKDFIENAGYEKEMDLFAYYVDADMYRPSGSKELATPPEKLARVAEKIKKRRNFTVRTADMKNFDQEVERIKHVYNVAWEKNWGFIPLSDGEADKMAKDLKQIIDPDVVIIVEVEGELVAFGIPLPNLNIPLRLASPRPGRPQIFALLRLLWHWKVRGKADGIRVFGLGVLKEYRGTGIAALMFHEMMVRGVAKGYKNLEMSWILENNVEMNQSAVLIGGDIYKKYRVYEKTL